MRLDDEAETPRLLEGVNSASFIVEAYDLGECSQGAEGTMEEQSGKRGEKGGREKARKARTFLTSCLRGGAARQADEDGF